jgi:tetratricopeptide (TPR) repeat protein
MNIHPDLYERLIATGEKYWRDGRTIEAAEAYLSAAQCAPFALNKASAYAHAGTLFALAKNKEKQVDAKKRATQLWMKVAEEQSDLNLKIDSLWQAFMQSMAIRDGEAQADCVKRIIDVVRTFDDYDTQWLTLKRLYDGFPHAGDRESSNFLQSELAYLRVSQASGEDDSNSKVKYLKEALELYSEAKDLEGQESTLRLLHNEYYKRGAKLEKEVADYQSLEDRARAYEAAASAYSSYCEEERFRCLKLAREMRAEAVRETQGIPQFQNLLIAFGQAVTIEESKIRSTAHSAWSLGVSSNEEYVKVQSLTGFFALDNPNFHDEFFRFFASYCELDPNDPIIKKLIENLAMSFGESSSYCPTPAMTPQWIVTTRFSKIALALTAGTVTGALSGLVAGGADLKMILVGVVGAHAAILVNLISAYLLMHDDNEKQSFSELLNQYINEPAKVYVILELKKRPQTIRQLYSGAGYSESRMRRIVGELKSRGIIREQAGSSKPVYWELTNTNLSMLSRPDEPPA